MYRAMIVGVLLLCACKGGDKGKPGSTGSASRGSAAGSGSAGSAGSTAVVGALRTRVPVVDGDDVTVLPKDAPPGAGGADAFAHQVPLVVVIDEAGTMNVAAAPQKWGELGAFEPKQQRKVDGKFLYQLLAEGRALGKLPQHIYDDIAKLPTGPDGTVVASAPDPALDDPPPPPPEDEEKPDDGADESGGTGTAMQLDEGKMGKRDSDRAEGQYKMKRNQEDPQLARQHAIEEARKAGILGSKALLSAHVRGARDVKPSNGEYPTRLATMEGAVHIEGNVPPLPALIAAHPAAKASAIIAAIEQSGAPILVAHGQNVRPLRVLFAREQWTGVDVPEDWIEVRVTAGELVVEGVPGTPTTVKQPGELATAYRALANEKRYGKVPQVDVLVGPDVTAQRLVDVLAALDRAGARAIAIGLAPAPDAVEAKLRGKAITMFLAGRPTVNGDLEKSQIQGIIKNHLPKLRACYETAKAKQPALAGTVLVSFLITASGNVQTASASGVDPGVADCLAKTLRTIEFPSSKSGGNVQVNQPFTMR